MSNSITLRLVSQNLHKVKFQIEKLELNDHLKDNWINFKPGSLASFKIAFFRITDSDNKQTYFILRNAFFIYENDSDDITIRYNDTLQPLYQKEEITPFLQDKEQQLTKLVEEQKYLTALDDLNISTINKVKIQELEDQIWVLKAYTLFALDPTEEAQWN
ncbi:MSC_0621 family F1-like ATPase epsilon subunit [Mycoplasma nasistruthionis]|uniref:Uncharacterized protein n=1 Tax=Mycoplasma nasistruthionis TaxID=353852 RepID=A0A5B7XUY5_9MOLU|nr:hypothetical protein [Mycoplasma nasistruthionis]QCZ36731.1 hypothetical protein FG904_01760 [Mycoplasma nasistruthionis]